MSAEPLTSPLIELRHLGIAYLSGSRQVDVITDIALSLGAGDVLGLVGESGSGKSTLASALLGSLRTSSFVSSGSVRVAGQDPFALKGRALRRFRSSTIALVPQNAGAALTPTMRVGDQLIETISLQRTIPGPGRRAEAERLLRLVRLPNPAEALEKYPHQFSGGQQQRIGIAMALAARPAVLVLDEPTTGLDVVTQAAILETLEQLQHELGMSMVLVSHDLGVIERLCSDVAVMRQGRVVESGPTAQVLSRPQHPYTRGLIASIPRIAAPGIPPSLDETVLEAHERGQQAEPRTDVQVRRPPAGTRKVLEIRGLTVDYRRKPSPGTGPTVEDVDLDIFAGEIVALVGESGSGKSTIANVVAGLQTREAGTLTLEDGEKLGDTASRRPRPIRKAIQMIFQNADTSLNPRHTVGDAVGRPARLFGLRGRSVEAALAEVDLPATFSARLPGQLSGGQRQRVGIARAIVAEPTLVLADEIVSALDVSVQSSILRLMDRLSVERELGFLFITHDLAVVRAVADRVVVLYLGRIVEEGRSDEIFSGVSHPYTRLLLDSVIELGHTRHPVLTVGRDEVPDAPPATGCPFAGRCPLELPACRTVRPPVIELTATHRLRCHASVESLEALSGRAAEKSPGPDGAVIR
ncbi:ABC transporter ATP-binding protein [Sinomonas cellulolyticus]|uniref:ABC transporter ATP-binding protein n=1 Tax=Sinomonas cellulolyticus TaxID=2801916 RepID=A0ABS1K5J6_9MICC|nr:MULTISPECIES: ABC transporter ATP-binding protein [Sinomonas]MBL0706950.1 ABC transporter ATP-binding protein [Sinomonas cellulolyticus]GHG59904.1 ABC transporter ATP-binding protein [Sinomonas sp. KCTC 49339]